MADPTFELIVDSVEFTLIDFDGEESMNRLFEYRFTCEAPDAADFTKVAEILNADATFTVKEYDTSIYTGDIDIPGYISQASRQNGNWILTFLPKIHKSTKNNRSEIYFESTGTLDASKIIVDEMDNDIVLEDRDYVNNISSGLPTRNLFCQYNESNYNFIARLCDYWGIHFYFDHFATNIVFANDALYDQEITEPFKTTSTTSDNHKLKIRDWNEIASTPHNYITVIGHDHNNAGSNIEASYPETNTSNLVERRISNAGVNSQVEAEYLAQMRYEELNCKNSLATGTTKVPYLMPGFKIQTDDTEFAEAVVIKSTHRGRDLNSTSAGSQPSYECEIEAIPADVIYRPTSSYPTPQATTILGKTITSAESTTLAERNETGEYRVEFLGFENESGISTSHPWVRKAQTTGGSNSVDVPLTPETEVLLAFVDNNPNCPYIQHAMDNSLHPVPVSSANAHHAVISTDGMLVTSALQGRYNVTTTRQEDRVDDSAISSTIKNYYTNRGDFNQNANFIDPSATNNGFIPEDRASGNYIITQQYGDQVQIAQGDRLHWHNGNLYDFGGYWNFNLGNSYEENFIDQGSPLRIKVNKDNRSGDMLTNNGPNWSSINFSGIVNGQLAESDVKPASYGSTAIATDRNSKTFQVNTGGEWSADGMNVSKSYNASYDYKFGDAIDVSDRVNTLEVKHTDSSTESIEVVIHNGVVRSWEKAVGRVITERKWASNGSKTFEGFSETDSEFVKIEEETKWTTDGVREKSYSKTTERPESITTDEKTYNMATGALAAQNTKTNNGMGFAEYDFSYSETAIAKFDFGGTKSFSISAQGDASIAISFSGSAELKIGFGLSMEIKTGVEIGMELDLRTGSSLELDSKGKLEWNGIGFKARSEARAEAKQKNIDLETKIIEIADKQIKLGKANVALDNNGVKVNNEVQVNI